MTDLRFRHNYNVVIKFYVLFYILIVTFLMQSLNESIVMYRYIYL